MLFHLTEWQTCELENTQRIFWPPPPYHLLLLLCTRLCLYSFCLCLRLCVCLSLCLRLSPYLSHNGPLSLPLRVHLPLPLPVLLPCPLPMSLSFIASALVFPFVTVFTFAFAFAFALCLPQMSKVISKAFIWHFKGLEPALLMIFEIGGVKMSNLWTPRPPSSKARLLRCQNINNSQIKSHMPEKSYAPDSILYIYIQLNPLSHTLDNSDFH